MLLESLFSIWNGAASYGFAWLTRSRRRVDWCGDGALCSVPFRRQPKRETGALPNRALTPDLPTQAFDQLLGHRQPVAHRRLTGCGSGCEPDSSLEQLGLILRTQAGTDIPDGTHDPVPVGPDLDVDHRATW